MSTARLSRSFKKSPADASHETNGENEDKLAPFRFHGLVFTRVGSSTTQHVSDCPFCGKHKFFINSTNGLWDCKVCGKSGNTSTFLRFLLEFYTSHNNVERGLTLLAKLRKIPKEVFFDKGIGCDEDLSRFYLPVYSPTKPNTLLNLRVWEIPTEEDPKPKVKGTTGIKQGLLLADNLLIFDKAKHILLCEGDWDAYALDWLRAKLDLMDVCVVGTPGAHVFKKEWAELFRGKIVWILFDADDPGQRGMEKVASLLENVAEEVKCLVWPAVAEGYDINDFIAERQTKPKQAWKELQALLQPALSLFSPEEEEVDDEADLVPPPFKEILKEYRKYGYLDQDMKDAITIVLAAALSIKLPGSPVWVFLIGASSSGKSLILDSMSTSNLCLYESTLRPNSLFSGKGEEYSLIPKLKGRCLVLRDYTGVRSQDKLSQERIYGILREAYDGEYKVQYGNMIEEIHVKDNFFSFVAGTTHEIHGDNRASLGERFLKCELLGNHFDRDAHTRAGIMGMDTVKRNQDALRQKVKAFLSQKVNLKKLPKIPKWVIDRLIALANLTAFLRASVDYSRVGDLNYRPRPEVGTRLAKQLAKLARCLAIVLGKSTIDQECYRLVEQTAFHTATGFHLEVIKTLMENDPRPLSRSAIALRLRLSESSVDRKLHSLIELEAVERVKQPKDSDGYYKRSGHPTYLYRPTKTIRDLWLKAKISIKL